MGIWVFNSTGKLLWQPEVALTWEVLVLMRWDQTHDSNSNCFYKLSLSSKIRNQAFIINI